MHLALRFVALRLAVCACVLFGRRGGGRLRRNRNSLRRIQARQQGASGAAGTPAGAGVFGGAGGCIQHDGVDAAFKGVFYLLGGGGLTAQGGADAVAQATDGAVEGAEEVAGSHEVVPPREHFAAQQGAVGEGAVDGGQRVLVFFGGDGGKRLVRRLLACLFGGKHLQVTGEGFDGTGEGLPGDGGAGGCVGAEFADPQGQRGEADGGEHALLVTLLFGDGVNQHGVDSRLVEHASQVVFDGFFVAFGHAVEHYGDCDGACGGLVEQFPGHGVGVAVGGGDEEPQVCGGE